MSVEGDGEGRNRSKSKRLQGIEVGKERGGRNKLVARYHSQPRNSPFASLIKHLATLNYTDLNYWSY